MSENADKTVADLFEELKNDESFLPDPAAREQFVNLLKVVMIDL